MKGSNSEAQEGSDKALIEDIHQIINISLGEGAAKCQVCGSSLREGESVVVYVFRPADGVIYQVGYVVCGDEKHELPKEYTLGVRELVVAGRVGWCADVATQSSWPVLLDPELVAVSAAAAKSARLVSDDGPPANVLAEVEEPEAPESLVEVSLGEAQRRSDRPDDDTVCGVFWGDRR